MTKELEDAMDIYLAIKASGGNKKLAYTIKEASEMRKLFEVIEQKHIKKDFSYLHIQEENERLLTDLREAVSKNIETQASIVYLTNKINELFRTIEKIKSGSIDPDSELRRMEKDAKTIEKRIETISAFDYEAEVRKLRELDIKEQSFRFNKKLA